MKRKFSKLLALLMCMAMFVSILPAAYAEENEIAEAQTEPTEATSTEERNPAPAETEQSEAAEEPLTVTETVLAEEASMPEALSLTPDESGNYTVSSFEELKTVLASLSEGESVTISWVKEGENSQEFRIAEDITIPKGVNLQIKEDIAFVVPHGVTLTVNGGLYLTTTCGAELAGALIASDAQIELEAESVTITGTISFSGYTHGKITNMAGSRNFRENITLGSTSYLELYYNVTNEADLLAAVDLSNRETAQHVTHYINTVAPITLTQDLTLYKANLDLFADLTIAESATLTIQHVYILELSIWEASLFVNGKLINDSIIDVSESSITLKNAGCYSGSGLIRVSVDPRNSSVSDPFELLIGFDRERFSATGSQLGGWEVRPALRPGDLTGDGSVDLFDLFQLKKHLAGVDGVSVNAATADVTGDGAVDLFDLFRLKQYLAGMDVTLG